MILAQVVQRRTQSAGLGSAALSIWAVLKPNLHRIDNEPLVLVPHTNSKETTNKMSPLNVSDHFFSQYYLKIKLFAALYTLGIPLSHFILPHNNIWDIATFFLVAMLFTYPLAAMQARAFVRLEWGISCALAAMGLLGLFTSPWLIILAIFGHGLWDLAKQRGHGIPFFGWYISGCILIDWLYAASLTLFKLMEPTL